MIALVRVGKHRVIKVVVDVELGGEEALDRGRLLGSLNEIELGVAGSLEVQSESADDGMDVVRCEQTGNVLDRGVVGLDDGIVRLASEGRGVRRQFLGCLDLISIKIKS